MLGACKPWMNQAPAQAQLDMLLLYLERCRGATNLFLHTQRHFHPILCFQGVDERKWSSEEIT